MLAPFDLLHDAIAFALPLKPPEGFFNGLAVTNSN